MMRPRKNMEMATSILDGPAVPWLLVALMLATGLLGAVMMALG
jgi:hypothetical protein